MDSNILAVRAIGAELAQRLWWTALAIVLTSGVVVALLMGWLISGSGWWWLVAAPLVIGFSVALGLLGVSQLLIRYVRPQQSPSQKKAVAQFVNRLQGTEDVKKVSRLTLLVRSLRSIAAPSSDKYLSNLAKIKPLSKDYQAIIKLF